MLILDEPTNGLDPVGIIEVRDLIRGLAADGRRTVILASHLLNEVEQVCDQVAVLRRGQLLYCGPVAGMGAPASALVRTTDDDRAATVLKDAGWEIRTRSAGRPGESQPLPAGSGEISRDLANAGVYVSQLRPASGSLEAGFMEVTGEGEQASA